MQLQPSKWYQKIAFFILLKKVWNDDLPKIDGFRVMEVRRLKKGALLCRKFFLPKTLLKVFASIKNFANMKIQKQPDIANC